MKGALTGIPLCLTAYIYWTVFKSNRKNTAMEKQCNQRNSVQIPTGIEIYAEHLGVCRAQYRARRRIEKDTDHYVSVFTKTSNLTSASYQYLPYLRTTADGHSNLVPVPPTSGTCYSISFPWVRPTSTATRFLLACPSISESIDMPSLITYWVGSRPTGTTCSRLTAELILAQPTNNPSFPSPTRGLISVVVLSRPHNFIIMDTN